jgi:hypothetical protein
MRSKAENRPRLNSVDRQRAAVDAPSGPGAQVLVVVAQVPHQIGDLAVVKAPVVRHTGDAAKRVVGIGARRIHLADDRVLGSGDTRQGGHRRAHAVPALAVAHRLERSRRVRKPEFGCVGE